MGISRRTFVTQVVTGTASVALLPALAACGAAQTGGSTAPAVKFGDPVTAVFWHTQTGTNAEALTELVTKFNSVNGKNITLKAENQGSYTQVYQKVMASIQAGSPPDSAVAYESMVAEYMKANVVVDLDDYASKGASAYSKESLNDIFPQYMSSNRYEMFNNKLLSFPFHKSLAVQYYNDDLLRGAGQSKVDRLTFDEFKRQAAAVTKKDGGKTSVYAQHIKIDASYIDAFIFANGGDLLTKDQTKVRFNEQPGVEIFEMWGNMVRDGQAYAAPAGDFTYQADFGQGKVAGLHDTSTGRSFIKKEFVDQGSSKERFKWGIGLIPQKDVAKASTVLFGGNIAVFKTDQLKQAAAWEWIRFFMDKEQSVTWALKSSYMPARKSVADSPDMKAFWEKEPQAKQAFDLTQYARPEPSITAWQDIRGILQNALTAVITGKATSKAALDDAAKQADKLIEEKR